MIFFGAEGEEIGTEGGFAVGEVTLGKEGRLVLGGQDGILLAAVDHLRDNRQAALVGCFGRSFDMTGSVRAFRGIEFAIG